MKILDEIRERLRAAEPGPWRWHGNTDHPDSISLESRQWVILGTAARERSEKDKAFSEYVDYLLDSYSFVSESELDGLTPEQEQSLAEQRATERARQDYLENPGRFGDEPVTDRRLWFGREGFAQDLAVYEVCQDATSRDDPRVYRADIVGLRSANAALIANAPADIGTLLAAIDAVLAVHPADHATSIRDYGRGYAQAIRDVRSALESKLGGS